MANTDRIDFNLTGHDYAPNKFTRKNIIRRITDDGSSGDLVVYDALIIKKLDPGKEMNYYYIEFGDIIESTPDIASKIVDFSIDTGSSSIQSTWSSYPIPWFNNVGDEFLTIFLEKSTNRIVITTLGSWGDYYANIYINAYVPR